MKLDSSTLFVNTGRKPLPAMQKKKKNNKNTVALVVCIAIIAVLCVFVGLIVHVWFNYNEEVAPKADTKVTTEIKEEKVKPKEEKPKKLIKILENKSLRKEIFKSFGFWSFSLVTVAGIPIGITTTFIFGVVTSGVGGATLFAFVVIKIILFKKQMKKIKTDNKKENDERQEEKNMR